MFERILLGMGRRMLPVPEWVFRKMVGRYAKRIARKELLDRDQRRAQHFAVREIARRREPIAPDTFATELDLGLEQVSGILGLAQPGVDKFVYLRKYKCLNQCEQQ